MTKMVSGILLCQNSNYHKWPPELTARVEKNTWGEYKIPLWEDAFSEKSNPPEKVLPKDRVYCPVGPTTGCLCVTSYISHEFLSMSSKPHNAQQSKGK